MAQAQKEVLLAVCEKPGLTFGFRHRLEIIQYEEQIRGTANERESTVPARWLGEGRWT